VIIKILHLVSSPLLLFLMVVDLCFFVGHPTDEFGRGATSMVNRFCFIEILILQTSLLLCILASAIVYKLSYSTACAARLSRIAINSRRFDVVLLGIFGKVCNFVCLPCCVLSSNLLHTLVSERLSLVI
jgi:hypothetical protein